MSPQAAKAAKAGHASKLDQLRDMTVVVADTGDIDAIKRFSPEDATTNPSLLLKVADHPAYAHLVKDAIKWAKKRPGDRVRQAADKLAVNVGAEITKIVPGRVSTEVDAELSFNAAATTDQARYLIDLYRELRVPPERVLIKIAATFEGIIAAETLQEEGIDCNMTLLFSLTQAAACAEAGAFLISPFVGRILDWYKAAEGRDFVPHEDPGVVSVTRIYHYLKHFEHDTVVMGASFRNVGEIEELAGCDRLTIGPELLEALENDDGKLERKLDPKDSRKMKLAPVPIDEATFRWEMTSDAMASDKLNDGIRRFHADTVKLREMLAKRMD